MRYTLFVITAITLLSACTTVNLHKQVPVGAYNIKNVVYYEQIELRADSTFILTVKEANLTKVCQGNWRVKSVNELVLSGKDTRQSTGADSLFYSKLNCSQIVVRFDDPETMRRNGYTLNRFKLP